MGIWRLLLPVIHDLWGGDWRPLTVSSGCRIPGMWYMYLCRNVYNSHVVQKCDAFSAMRLYFRFV